MNILTNEQIKEVREAITKIGSLAHYARNHWRGYSVVRGFTEEQEKACNLLNKYKIYEQTDSYCDRKNNELRVEKYLKKCSTINQIIDVVYDNNWTYDQMNENFKLVTQYFKDIFEVNQRELTFKQQRLLSQPLKDINKSI